MQDAAGKESSAATPNAYTKQKQKHGNQLLQSPLLRGKKGNVVKRACPRVNGMPSQCFWTEGFLVAEKACDAQMPLMEPKVERKYGS